MRILQTVFGNTLVGTFLKRAFLSLGHEVVSFGPPAAEGMPREDISEPDFLDWKGEGANRDYGTAYFDAKKIVKVYGTFDAVVQVEPRVLLYNIDGLQAPICYWARDGYLTRYSPFLIKVANGPEYMAQLKCNFYSKYGLKTMFEFMDEPATFLPWAIDPDVFRPMKAEKIYDVVFVGSDHPTLFRARDFLLDMLQEKGFSVLKTRASFDDYCMKIAQGRLAFNYAIDGEFGTRFFELLGMGACQLTNMVHGQELLGFQHLKHLINFTFYDVEHWVQIYKDDAEEFERIGRVGREKVLAEHTFVVRAQQILDALFA